MRSSKVETDIKVPEERSLRTLPPTYAPSLVFTHGKNYRDQTFCTLSDQSYHLKSVPELRRMKYLALCYGWLILQKYNDLTTCYLFDPVTLTTIHLPPLINDTFIRGALTSSPNDPNCIIVFFSGEKNSCIFCQIGGTRWIEQDLRTNKKSFELINGQFRQAICCQGKIYLFHFKGIAVIDFYDLVASIELCEDKWINFTIPETVRFSPFFLESCGEIFQVIQLLLGTSEDIIQTIDVYKLDLSTLDWVKVENIGDRIFLLGKYTASCSAAEVGLKGNCIYFWCPRYTALFKFDMDDGTITTTLPCPKNFPYWRGPFWVVPNCNPQVNKCVSKVDISKKIVPNIRESKGGLDKKERSWEDLPIDQLQLISSSLCQCDCIRFCLTCKYFLSISPKLQPNPLLIQSNYESQQLPWFMCFPTINKDVCNFYNSITSDAYTMEMPELAGAIIRDANYGWLLISQGYYSIFFFNPLTKEIIKLPDLDLPYSYVGITFSAPPNSPDCIVLGVGQCHPNFFQFTVYCKEEGTWCEYEDRVDCARFAFMTSDCNPVFCNGVFYCLSKDGKLAIFDPGRRDDLSWRLLPVPPIYSFSNSEDFTTNRRGFLVEHNGDIFSIFMGFLGKSIQVSKLDRLKTTWVKLESLGDKVLFLSPNKSLLISAGLKGIGNRIYLPRFNGGNMMFYHCLGSKCCEILVVEIGQILVSSAGIVLGSVCRSYLKVHNLLANREEEVDGQGSFWKVLDC